jgi:hypothetical protein
VNDETMPVLAVCSKCGREFVWLSKRWREPGPVLDAYPAQNVTLYQGQCGGVVELTEAGRASYYAFLQK